MKRSTLKSGQTVKRYSEAFKQKVLREISEGKINKSEALKKYGLGTNTLYLWIRKYHRDDLFNPKVRVEMPDERSEKQRLKEENKQLKEALIQLQLRAIKSEADLLVALEELGYTDKAAFEKKRKANPSKKQ